MKQKKPVNFNPFVLIFGVVILAWIATFLITPGTLVDGVYTALPKNTLNFNSVFDLFRSIPYGIKDTANLVILVLVIGGALEIFQRLCPNAEIVLQRVGQPVYYYMISAE